MKYPQNFSGSIKTLGLFAAFVVLTMVFFLTPSASALTLSELGVVTSNPSPFPTASLVKEGGTIYLINGAFKTPFANYKAFTGLGYSLRNVVMGDLSNYTPDSYVINTANTTHPWGGWISYKGEVYYSASDGMIGVPSAEVFLSNGGKWNLVVKANKYDIASISGSNSLAVLTDSDVRLAGQTALQFGNQPVAQNNLENQNSDSPLVNTTPPATAAPISIIPQIILPTNIYASTTATYSVISGATNTPLTYTFFWGDGSPTNPLSINSAVHTYFLPGTYILEVTVIDNLNNANTSTTPVTVVMPPSLTPTVPQFTLPNGIIIGAPVIVTASASDPQNSPLFYTFSWGDGSADTVAPSNSATHTYSTSESFVVKVTVTNNQGFSNSSQGYLYVAP